MSDFNPRSPHGERHNPPDDDLLAEVISTHAPRTGSDGDPGFYESWDEIFQPTLPARGATLTISLLFCACTTFQPTLPARGATRMHRLQSAGIWYFNPRSPHGERPRPPLAPETRNRDFNPRSPHGERRRTYTTVEDIHGISTHAPRTGSDTHLPLLASPAGDISTHAPRTGSDVRLIRQHVVEQHFNPRSPHGERLPMDFSIAPSVDISTHAPRTGSDFQTVLMCGKLHRFQPTLPARGATPPRTRRRWARCYFNPRSPHGERLSARAQRTPTGAISTHAPRTGSD